MNLTDINGIGPATAEKLTAEGIDSVQALSEVEDVSLYSVTIDPNWIEQAKALVTESQPPEPESSQDEPASISDKKITFDLISGSHKGKTINWKVGDPAMVIGRAGTYLGLYMVSVSKIETNDGNTKFKFIWNQTISGAELPEDQFKVFAEHVKKNERPSYDVNVTQNSGVLGRAVQGVQNLASGMFGGCTGCGN